MKTRHVVFVVYLLHVLHIKYLLYTSFTFTCYIFCTLKTIQQFTHYTYIQWTDVTLTQSKDAREATAIRRETNLKNRKKLDYSSHIGMTKIRIGDFCRIGRIGDYRF